MYFDATEFAARLSTLRKAQGMTQEEMAEVNILVRQSRPSGVA